MILQVFNAKKLKLTMFVNAIVCIYIVYRNSCFTVFQLDCMKVWHYPLKQLMSLLGYDQKDNLLEKNKIIETHVLFQEQISWIIVEHKCIFYVKSGWFSSRTTKILLFLVITFPQLVTDLALHKNFKFELLYWDSVFKETLLQRDRYLDYRYF